MIEQQRETLRQSISGALKAHESAVARLIEVPGFGIDSAQQVIAEIGPHAAAFASAGKLASWVGVCPVSASDRCPKGNRTMRRVLTQVALAAVKTNGCIFQTLYRRWLPRLGHPRAVWAIAHRLCRLTWLILHEGATYRERSPQADAAVAQLRVKRLVRQLQTLGYQVQLTWQASA